MCLFEEFHKITAEFHHLTGSMSDLLILVAINVIKGLVFVFDVVTYIPRYVIEQPYKKLALSNRRRVCFLNLFTEHYIFH